MKSDFFIVGSGHRHYRFQSIAIRLDGGDATLISWAEEDDVPFLERTVGETPTYNLQGQQVGDGYKGIVILNGKKVLVK